MEAPSSQPLSLCYCYAYEDSKYVKDLDKHLHSLKMLKIIQAWHDCVFSQNDFWKQEVANSINTSQFVLLLISADFIASEKWYHREIAFAMERHNRGEAHVIPIYLSDVDLEGTYLSELRMLPSSSISIVASRNKAQVYTSIARAISQVAKDILATRDTRSIPPEHSYHQSSALADLPPNLISAPDRQRDFLSISWSPDASWLAVGATDGTVQLYGMNNYADRYTLPGHIRDVYSVAWSTNNVLASGSADCTVRLWNASEKRVEQVLQGHAGSVNSIAWSPDGKHLVSSAADKTLRLWNASKGNELHALTGHTRSIMSVAWSPNGMLLASGSRDRTVLLWDARNGRELRPFQHQADIMSVAWSPDSRVLAVGSGNHVRLWDVSSGSELYILRGHMSIVTAVAWSPDGKFLASSSWDQTVHLWDPALGHKLRTLQGHAKNVLGIAWSPDGRCLATMSCDELYVWNTETWEQIAVSDNQQALKKVIRQPSRILRATMAPYDDKDSSEFQLQEVEAETSQQAGDMQKAGLLKGRQTNVCPFCHTPFPEKQVNNIRKRGLTRIFCCTCQTSVSLPESQEQRDGEVASNSDRSADVEQQNVQMILQHKVNTQTFDVFFCYNSQDKVAVKQIGKQLKQYGILPWLDEWELRPGLSWQRALEEQIRKIKAAAVFVGPQGMGPWHNSEMYAFLRQVKKRNCPVIPVLLQGVPEEPELPIWLEEMSWVDFRYQEPDPMQQLLWGITGKK